MIAMAQRAKVIFQSTTTRNPIILFVSYFTLQDCNSSNSQHRINFSLSSSLGSPELALRDVESGQAGSGSSRGGAVGAEQSQLLQYLRPDGVWVATKEELIPQQFRFDPDEDFDSDLFDYDFEARSDGDDDESLSLHEGAPSWLAGAAGALRCFFLSCTASYTACFLIYCFSCFLACLPAWFPAFRPSALFLDFGALQCGDS